MLTNFREKYRLENFQFGATSTKEKQDPVVFPDATCSLLKHTRADTYNINVWCVR